jgi:hypothetical protein
MQLLALELPVAVLYVPAVQLTGLTDPLGQ